jgi:hypothetical protein
MTGEDAKDDPQGRGGIVQFPHSRVMPPHQSFDPDAPIVVGAMANILGIPSEQTTGHWCSRCHKVWFGYLLEVSCPLCGNRHG